MARRHGFTIAETLVALLVFSLVLSILSLAATNLTRYYQSSQNQQREAQVARAIMSLEVPDTRLTLTECFKRQLVLYSKTGIPNIIWMSGIRRLVCIRVKVAT